MSRSVPFVIQNAAGGCEDGHGDPDDASNMGRRGLVDLARFFNPDPFAGGLERSLPFLLDVVVPEEVEGVTISMQHVAGLRGPGQLTNNQVCEGSTSPVRLGGTISGHTFQAAPAPSRSSQSPRQLLFVVTRMTTVV